MNDSQKVKMHLNIGEQRLSINTPFERQEFVRDVEASIQRLYGQWRNAFASKTDREILAMVTYQFASHYLEMKEAYEEATRKASECLSQLKDEPEQSEEDDSIFD